MKFERKFQDVRDFVAYNCEYTQIIRVRTLGSCQSCKCFTRWMDLILQVPVCSEECDKHLWERFLQTDSVGSDLTTHLAAIDTEKRYADDYRVATKDILIVVHNQLSYVKECVQSIIQNTENYRLRIWDNGSEEETAKYLASLDCKLHRSETNTGFILPNNRLAEECDSDYIILLNSDTLVFSGWDKFMIGCLQSRSEIGQVGYFGGLLGSDGRGYGGRFGEQIDYIPGWCFCISQETYQRFGLFDEGFRFAYCEDSDLSLRLKAAGKGLLALHTPLVHHYQNKTIRAVEQDGKHDVSASFQENHERFRSKWATLLSERK